MKKYDSGTDIMMKKCTCCCMCITFNVSESDLFSKSKRNVVSHVGA